MPPPIPDPGKGKTRPNRGGDRGGPGRPKTEVRKAREELAELCRERTPELMRIMLKHARGKDPQASQAACKFLLEMGWGKAVAKVDAQVNGAVNVLGVVGVSMSDF